MPFMPLSCLVPPKLKQNSDIRSRKHLVRQELLEAFNSFQTAADTSPSSPRPILMTSWVSSPSELFCFSLPYISMLSNRFHIEDPRDAAVMQALFPALDKIFNTNLSKFAQTKAASKHNTAKITNSSAISDEIDENSD